ncbi:hypothetical protein [Lederbergia citrea]|uniref:Uncharacterized protein n=1 Tax=Lederbergia citrea TaxID=2833581 RepID=A0A942Z4C0_9BACI|nr:hypothetical protein [Lederbergia citrea]MBS4179409.1 hypothetical protein [Lederbergia citrea]MBS4206078.1 hypothetical protein [Lederbergia citrea]MBS4224473.1 hypothetical protein [Lederbergia citrea]
MKKRKNPVVNEEKMLIQANLNNVVPGDSVDEERAVERGNEMLAHDEIEQQNNNL